MLSEFDIIRRCFDQPGLAAEFNEVVTLGIGDDCALISVPSGKELAVSIDTLAAGVHFPESADPAMIGWRSLAVNLSDLAATGAEPLFFTLALTLPEADESWLQSFAEGLKSAATRYGCYLAGGNICHGPLNVTIQVHGLVDQGKAIKRSGAKPGDRIYVTGSLGAAGMALEVLGNGRTGGVSGEQKEQLLAAYYHPEPRIETALALAPWVSAGIDISDGLLADLGHICSQSNTGAEIRLDQIPVSSVVESMTGGHGAEFALDAGDDYELILVVPRDNEKGFLEAAATCKEPLTCIGDIVSGTEVHCYGSDGNRVENKNKGYRHFHG